MVIEKQMKQGIALMAKSMLLEVVHKMRECWHWKSAVIGRPFAVRCVEAVGLKAYCTETICWSLNAMVNGLTFHMLVSVCLLGANLNVHAKPEWGGQCTHKHNIETHLQNYWYHGKATSIIYFACVPVPVALVIWHEKRICHIILSSVACLTVPIFSH
jgi:hypothetical protein